MSAVFASFPDDPAHLRISLNRQRSYNIRTTANCWTNTT
jgi:hypothetical protein